MNEPKVKYKKVDSLVHGEVKEIRLIGEDKGHENEKYYFVFWLNHNDEHRSTNVSHKELFDWYLLLFSLMVSMLFLHHHSSLLC